MGKLSTRIHFASLNLMDSIRFASIERSVARSRAAEIKKEEKEAKKAQKNNAAKEEASTEAKKATKVDKAETESPSEKAGAEKINADENQTTVNDVGEAAMAGGAIADNDPSVINCCGVQFNMGKVAEGEPIPNNMAQPQQATPGFNPQMQQPNMMPNMQFGYAPAPGFVATPRSPQENEYLKYLEMQKQAAANVHAGFGNHKVDNPQPPKQKPVKAEEDNVNVDLSNIHVDVNPAKPPKQWPDSVNNPLPNPEVTIELPKPAFDNSALKAKFKYLEDVENIALQNGVQVLFTERPGSDGNPSGLIECASYTTSSEPNLFKCFTIDTGVLIDRRAKVIPAVLVGGNAYEDYQMYPVHVKTDDQKGGKSKNEVNNKLFDDIFKGGINNINTKGMYTQDYLELNKVVALSTMPTNNMNSETRKAARDRLLEAMKTGVFENALKMAPNSRFMFKPGSYDKKTGSFVLTNVGVPFRFGGPRLSTKNVEITFGIKEVKIVDTSTL